MSANWLAKSFRAIRLVLWVAVTFIGAQFMVAFLASGLFEIAPGLAKVNDSVFVTIYAAVSYSLAVALAVGVPWWWKHVTSRTELGIHRLPLWKDLGLAAVGYVLYMLLSLAVTSVISALLGGAELNDAQDLPFGNLAKNFEFVVAFITLVVLAPFAEELLFRGYLLGKLKHFLPVWLAIGLSALVFGAMHLPGSTGLQWLVAIDTFVLGIVLATLRVKTGSIWAGVLVHAAKNAIAFYFLFINPAILGML